MLKRLVGILSGLVMASMLAGCAANFAPGPVTLEQTPIGEIQGNVHGGNFPVTGAQIYLFAAGQGGYGTSATSLMKSAASGVSCSDPVVTGACYVTTDFNGNFSLGGEYTCTEGQQVYVVAVGGNPGSSGSNVNNSAIVQMAALGQCPAAGSMAALVPYLTINEVTTVAFAYSVGGFATNAFNVSSDASGETAIANAFANANNIVNIAYGQAPAVVNGNSNSVNPQSKINALANILVTCVNQSSASASACTNLFKYATTSSGTAATDEATAIFNIVHNQAKNVTNIWNLTSTTPVFQPTLSSAPTDWTMPVVYSNVTSKYATGRDNEITGGASNIAFDANGNAWIGDRQKGVIQMTPTGAVTTHSSGFSMVKGIAVSPDSTRIWVTDYTGGGSGNGQLDVMSTDGTITTSLTTYMNGPSAVAVDANGDAFVANDVDGSVVGVSSTGTVIDHATGTGVTSPESIALDNSSNVWLPSASNSQVIGQVPLKYATNGTFKNFGTTGTVSADYSYGVAVDSKGSIWIASNETYGNSPLNENLDEIEAVTNKYAYGNYGYDNQSLLFSVAAVLSGSGSNGGGLGLARQVTVDGGNNVWMANSYYTTVSEYSQTLGAWQGASSSQYDYTQNGWGGSGFGSKSQSGGFSNGATGNTLSATPDPSGNLWTANEDGTVTELLGLATPTASPIYPGVQGTMP